MAIILLGIILNWAVRHGLLKENPCEVIKLAPVGTRDVILEDADDYARLFKTLERMEQELRIRQPAADAIRLIALTGCRRGEAAGLRWRHVERDRIVLPPASTRPAGGRASRASSACPQQRRRSLPDSPKASPMISCSLLLVVTAARSSSARLGQGAGRGRAASQCDAARPQTFDGEPHGDGRRRGSADHGRARTSASSRP